jgi:hypothetical protein
MKPCLDFIDKSPEILGNALAPNLKCTDNCGGRIRPLYDLCTWGYRADGPAPVRHDLSNNRRVGKMKRVTGVQRRNMKPYATVAQI